MEDKYMKKALPFVEKVFTEWSNEEEGKLVRSLVEEIRSKKYYLPELELIMVKELEDGALEHISGLLDYSFYETLK